MNIGAGVDVERRETANKEPLKSIVKGSEKLKNDLRRSHSVQTSQDLQSSKEIMLMSCLMDGHIYLYFLKSRKMWE